MPTDPLYEAVFGDVPALPAEIELTDDTGIRTAVWWHDPLCATDGGDCDAIHPLGFLCTRSADHPAPHAASGRHPGDTAPPRVMAVWWSE